MTCFLLGRGENVTFGLLLVYANGGLWLAKVLDSNKHKAVSLLYFIRDVLKILVGELISIVGVSSMHTINVVCNNSGSALDRHLGEDINVLLRGSCFLENFLCGGYL